jgi:hypothetical protein
LGQAPPELTAEARAVDELLGKLNQQLAGSDHMVLMALLGVAIGLPPNCR